MPNKGITALLVFVFCASFAVAQTERGSIRGTVFDTTGAVVPNATITATNVATNVAASTASTDAGTYNFPALAAGSYRLEVKQTGFKNLVRENIVVGAAAVLGLDLKLDVGDVNEVVRVTEQGSVLRTETSSTNTEVDNKAYVDLPLSSAGGGRKAEGFMLLVPGYSGSPGGFGDSINGGQTASKEIQMDGISLVTAEITGDGRNVTMPPDSVQELSVATSGYAAEYGNSGGGVERFVLKSGTNELHGDAYEFVRNTVFDAHGFFNAVRPIHKENEYGFTAGAPIIIPKLYNGRNKSFLFFGLNWYTFRNASSTSTLSVPNNAFRSGDLSGVTQKIYDPNTTTLQADGSSTRTPFAGNIIPANRISPVAQSILNLTPQSTTQSVFNNYFAQVPATYNNRKTYTIKGDHYFNGSHHISISDVYTENPSTGSSGLPQPIGGSSINSFSYIFGRVTYDWTIKPTMLNQLRIGVNRQTQYQDSPERNNAWPQKLGLTGMELAAGGFPNISWGSFSATGVTLGFNNRVSNTYLLSDALSWSRGRHNLKFGAEIRDMNSYKKLQNWASLTFSRNETALPSALSTTGLEYASFLLGQVDQAGQSLYGPFLPHETTYQVGLYAQDDFKLTPRLTLNYGVRYDLYTPTAESHGIYGIVNTTLPNPAAGNLPGRYIFADQEGQGNRLPPADHDIGGLAPRLGLAWKLKDKLVIRTGYGISYFGTGAYGGGNNTNLADGYWITSAAASLNSGVTPAYTFAQGFPASSLVKPPFLNPSLGLTGAVVNYWDVSAARLAYSQNWNVSVQRQLASDLSLEVGWVGSKGTRLPVRDDINQLNPAYFPLGSLLNANITAPAVVAAGYKLPFPGFQGTLAQALRPFPQFVNMAQGGKSTITLGNSTYHSLQVTLNKRFSKGIGGILAYTFSKDLTDTPNNYATQDSVSRNYYDHALDKTYASFDRPQNLAIGFNYELPFGSGKRLLNYGGPVDKILGGWQLNGILTYRSGAPLGVSAPQTNPLMNGTVAVSAFGGGVASPQTADAVIGATEMASWSGKFDPAKNVYANINAFTLPAGYFGTTSLFLPGFRSPFVLNEDLGLSKKTRIRERVNLEFRLEAFNAFNRVVFGSPSLSLATPSTFGKITGVANSARNAQLAAKITF